MGLALLWTFDFYFHWFGVAEPLAARLGIAPYLVFLSAQGLLGVVGLRLTIRSARESGHSSVPSDRIALLIWGSLTGLLVAGHLLLILGTVLIKTGVARS